MLPKLKILMALGFLTISTLCLGQKDSIICLYNKQIRFFALEHNSAQFLREDTAKKSQDIQIYLKIIQLKDSQLVNYEQRVASNSLEIVALKNQKIQDDKQYEKSQKRLKFFRNCTLILLGIVAIESSLIAIAK